MAHAILLVWSEVSTEATPPPITALPSATPLLSLCPSWPSCLELFLDTVPLDRAAWRAGGGGDASGVASAWGGVATALPPSALRVPCPRSLDTSDAL